MFDTIQASKAVFLQHDIILAQYILLLMFDMTGNESEPKSYNK